MMGCIQYYKFDFVLIGPSPLNSQNSEPATTAQYHHSMESASPSSSGKMMPSGGKGSKGGKPTSMSGLVRNTLPQQLPLQQQQQSQHPVYYNGGKGNPSSGNSVYPMMMTHSQSTPQQWIPGQQQPQPQPQPQQQIRYAAHGGKPMSYGQQRMPYVNDPYMMRQQTPQVPSSSASSSPYPYPSNIGISIHNESSLNKTILL